MSPYTLGNLLVVTVFTLWMACVESARAQATETSQEAIEEIVVTGSRISRRDFFSPSPISTIDRVALDAPLMADAVTSNNTDTRMYDIFGRSYSLSPSMRY